MMTKESFERILTTSYLNSQIDKRNARYDTNIHSVMPNIAKIKESEIYKLKSEAIEQRWAVNIYYLDTAGVEHFGVFYSRHTLDEGFYFPLPSYNY